MSETLSYLFTQHSQEHVLVHDAGFDTKCLHGII